MINETAVLTESGAAWGRVMGPWFQGEAVDLDAADQAQANLDTTLSGVRAKIEAMPASNDAGVAKFRRDMLEYLEFQAKVNREVGSYVAIAHEENPASQATREQVSISFRAINDEEIAWKSRLHDAARNLGVTIME
ncbi:hypothetical protein LOC69_13815 [Blastopirellula sp. JC733]|nr:hypothetical protein [Blastopirellula sediminis]